MTTIEIDIPDDLAQTIGAQSIKAYVQKHLELLKMQMLADKIGSAIEKSGIDWEEALEKARVEAWEEYQKNKP